MENHIIIEAIGWNKKEIANWSYRYYKFLIISNDMELIAFNGIYADTFGSVENIISKIRDISRKTTKLDLIITNDMANIKLPLRETQKKCKDDAKLSKLVELLEAQYIKK